MIYLNYISNGAYRYFFDDFEQYAIGYAGTQYKSGYHVRYGGGRTLSRTTGIVTGYDFSWYDDFESSPTGQTGLFRYNTANYGGAIISGLTTGRTNVYDNYFHDMFESYALGSISSLTLGTVSGTFSLRNGRIIDSGAII